MADNTSRLISTSTVVGSASHQETAINNQRIELTPWDLQFLLFDYVQNGLLFLQPTQLVQDQQQQQQQQLVENTLIHHLKTTLSRTLDFFPPLSGRLDTDKHDDGTTSYFIVCDNSGAEFTHAVAKGITVSDVLDPLFVPNSFFPLNDVQNFQGVSKPLLAVQVTELVDGIFIGCSINHMVVDGTSFWDFFNSWSEVSRSLRDDDDDDSPSITNPPFLRRWFLESTDPPIRLHLPEEGENLFKKFIQSPLLQERVFHFGTEAIAALKAKAHAEAGAINNDNRRISSLQTIFSHIWRSAIRSRRLDSQQEIHFKMYIGGRRRLMNPPLPTNYFGNSIHRGAITMRAGEVVLEHALGHVSLKMNEMIASQTNERSRNFLETWVKSPEFLTLGNTGRNALSTGSSPRFDVYGNDFGWGKPVGVRSGQANKFDGKLTVFPGTEEGSVMVEVCLLAETLEGMVNDPDFMDFVTV